MRLMTKQDIYTYKMGRGSDNYTKIMEEVEGTVGQSNFEFSDFKCFKMVHGDVVSPSNICDDFVIRKLNDNIKRVFGIKTIDRNRILPQIKVLLSEGGEFWLQKLDITKFFESIPHREAVSLVLNDPRISYDSKRLLSKIFSSSCLGSREGLPRGISLSSTLSELYMRKFDAHCRKLEGCYFYARYVDDILMLFHEEPGEISKELPLPTGLEFHPVKQLKLYHPQKGSVKASDNSSKVTYLGYEFFFENKGQGKAAHLQVGMAEKKIKKIKTRIMLALFDYCKSQNYRLLKRRLTFLASNYNIGKNPENGKLYAGIHYNNALIDEPRHGDLVSIDSFLQKSLFSKSGSLGKKLSTVLTNAQRRELAKISLMLGFSKVIVRSFTPEDLLEIKGIWSHV